MKAVGTNGLGEPRYPVAEVQPGSIVRLGIDDDMTVLVVANYPSVNYFSDGKGGVVTKPAQRLVYFGCFYDEPGPYDCGGRPWEEGRLFHQDHDLKDTLTVILTPEYS